MTITELIEHLEQLKEKHGDCLVFDFMGDEMHHPAEIDQIEYEEEGFDGCGPGLYL